ncbi:MAG: TIGR02206 family membrane protein [Rhodothermales bacterium]|nr:TIGR02206 family membrane protein [Rhodothermales bacterium]
MLLVWNFVSWSLRSDAIHPLAPARYMGQFWTIDYSGDPFELFGAPHIVVMVVVALISIALVVRGRRIDTERHAAIRRTLAALLVLNEVLWHVWAATEDVYTIQEMLPLHLCSVMVWLSAYALVRPNQHLYELMYFLGVAGSVQALLTPDAGIFGFPHFRFLQTMISHGLVFIVGIYVVAVEGYRPTRQSVVRVFLGLNLYALAVGLLNAAIGSNYLYVNGRPPTPSVIDLMPAWPWYLLYLEVIALGLLALLYLPFAGRKSPAVEQAGEPTASTAVVND